MLATRTGTKSPRPRQLSKATFAIPRITVESTQASTELHLNPPFGAPIGPVRKACT